ncbi:hypothetical protein ACQEU8_08945 [Streptomyces sp. CA-250714]|uniref:hypothetical protein n=1 Tax=Streptomyces sp. CA-250714 TaxID=3240060 RepID=UPI003D8FCAB3
MDITPYVDSLRRELIAVAGTGAEEPAALAERLVAPLESAARLALLDALTTAAEEISRELHPGSVGVRLRGRDPEFFVAQATGTPATDGAIHDAVGAIKLPPVPVASSWPPAPEADDSGTSRITLRLPNSLKSRVDQAAGHGGLSINAWLVRAVAGAVAQDELTRAQPRGRRVNQRFTGWVR